MRAPMLWKVPPQSPAMSSGQIAATQGAATTQRMIIQAAAGFQKSQVGSEVARNIRDTNIGASREVGSIIAGEKRDLYINAGNTSASQPLARRATNPLPRCTNVG